MYNSVREVLGDAAIATYHGIQGKIAGSSIEQCSHATVEDGGSILNIIKLMKSSLEVQEASRLSCEARITALSESSEDARITSEAAIKGLTDLLKKADATIEGLAGRLIDVEVRKSSPFVESGGDVFMRDTVIAQIEDEIARIARCRHLPETQHEWEALIEPIARQYTNQEHQSFLRAVPRKYRALSRKIHRPFPRDSATAFLKERVNPMENRFVETALVVIEKLRLQHSADQPPNTPPGKKRARQGGRNAF